MVVESTQRARSDEERVAGGFLVCVVDNDVTGLYHEELLSYGPESEIYRTLSGKRLDPKIVMEGSRRDSRTSRSSTSGTLWTFRPSRAEQTWTALERMAA